MEVHAQLVKSLQNSRTCLDMDIYVMANSSNSIAVTTKCKVTMMISSGKSFHPKMFMVYSELKFHGS